MKEDRAHFFAGFFKEFYGVGLVEHAGQRRGARMVAARGDEAGLKPTLACAAAFATTDFRPDLAAFKVPTLIIHGTADKTVPIDATGTRRRQGHRRCDADRI